MSEVFNKLLGLLDTGDWFNADRETASVMRQLTGIGEKSLLTAEDIEKIPLDVLQTIDQLWLTRSNQRFGFSIQKPLLASSSTYREFGTKVGWYLPAQQLWLNYADLDFSPNAPLGHLPAKVCSGVVAGTQRYVLAQILNRYQS